MNGLGNGISVFFTGSIVVPPDNDILSTLKAGPVTLIACTTAPLARTRRKAHFPQCICGLLSLCDYEESIRH